MLAMPKCSVVIANFNYAEYLPGVIESALDQTYPSVEVIAVDDGSTDRSREVLEEYRDRVTVVLKNNAGEASSRNAGFKYVSGDIVLFIDADDYLHADALERIVRVWCPGVAKAHYPLEIVDHNGAATGSVFPRWLPSGDVTALISEFGFYPSPPSSGNAYSRAVLERIMPIPEADFTRNSDTYLIALAALHGEVRAVKGPCAAWRRHHRNMSSESLQHRVSKLYRDILVVEAVRDALCRRPVHGALPSASWPQHLRERLTIAKLLRDQRIEAADSVPAVALRFVRSAWRWPAYGFCTRLAATAWAIAMALLPRSLASAIPQQALYTTRLPNALRRLLG
jgi:glycosyltransferase involved in cell wall biosynthesis